MSEILINLQEKIDLQKEKLENMKIKYAMDMVKMKNFAFSVFAGAILDRQEERLDNLILLKKLKELELEMEEENKNE